MLFTFFVLVAPQNAYPALQSLNVVFLSGGAALLILLIQTSVRGEFDGWLSREARLLGMFGALALLSIPFSLWPGGSWDLFLGLLLKSLIVYFLAAQLLAHPRRFRQHLWLTLLCCIAIAIIAVTSFWGGATSEGYRLPGSIAGLAANPNDLALTLNLFLPFGLVLCGGSSALGRLVAATTVTASIIAVVLSFSRAGFLTLLLILALFLLRKVRQRALPVLLAVSCLGFIGSLLVPEGYGNRLGSIVEHDKDELGSASARLADMIRAARVTIEHPVLGVGLGQSILAITEKGAFWHIVHNVYLQISADLGIPALIVFLLLFSRLVTRVRAIQARPATGSRSRELATLAWATEVSLWAYALAAMFHPVAYHSYFFYIAGFASALHTAHQRLGDRAGAA